MNENSALIASKTARFTRHVLGNFFFLVLGSFFVLLISTPFARFEGVPLLGGLPVMLIYYCSIRHRNAIRPLSIFLIGLLHDVLSGGAIGLWAFLYLSFFALLLTQHGSILRFIDRSAPFCWFGFLLASLVFLLLWWIMGWILTGSWPSYVGLALQWLVAAILFPLSLWRYGRQPLHYVSQE